MITAGASTSSTARKGALSDPAYQAFLLLRSVFTFPGYFDIALRDLGLLVGAVALARLATRYAPGRRTS